MLIDYFAIKLC